MPAIGYIPMALFLSADAPFMMDRNMSNKSTNINWVVYPTQVIETVAAKNNIEIGEFLYMLATKTLPNKVASELAELIANKAETQNV